MHLEHEPAARGKPAVLYAAKSTRDPHGSIPTQLDDGRALAVRDGLEVVAEYQDENESAYRGNRGSGLACAMAHAERMGGALIVQHSDRLARGDGERARHLVEIVLWARKSGVTLRSVQDPQTFDGMGLVYAALMGDRNLEDSSRKSKATRDGLRRRKEKGKPVGPVPLGYTVEKKVIEGEHVTNRVIDAAGANSYRAIMDMAETGASSGDIARALNRRGIRTKRDNSWDARQARKIIENDLYCGEKGYPKLIERERWVRIQDTRRRPEPAATQRRRGGRPAIDDYLLRGVGFCLRCGSPLYTRRHAIGRVYVCRAVRQCRGTCDALAIPAELAETQVLNHLNVFVGSVEEWINERLAQASDEQQQRRSALTRERAALETLEGNRDRLYTEYMRMVCDEDGFARLALEAVGRIDREIEKQQQAVSEADALLSEFSCPPDVDAALEYYSEVADVVQGKIRNARGAREINQALHGMLAGIWFDLEPERDRLLAEFELCCPPELRLADAHDRILHNPRRHPLPPQNSQYAPLEPLGLTEGLKTLEGGEGQQTGSQTFVYVHPVSSQICL